MPRISRVAFLGAALALLTAFGCNQPETTTRRSSLMDYLYPKEKAAPAPEKPLLDVLKATTMSAGLRHLTA